MFFGNVRSKSSGGGFAQVKTVFFPLQVTPPLLAHINLHDLVDFLSILHYLFWGW